MCVEDAGGRIGAAAHSCNGVILHRRRSLVLRAPTRPIIVGFHRHRWGCVLWRRRRRAQPQLRHRLGGHLRRSSRCLDPCAPSIHHRRLHQPKGENPVPPPPMPPPQQTPAGPGWQSSSDRSSLPPGPPSGANDWHHASASGRRDCRHQLKGHRRRIVGGHNRRGARDASRKS